jgi:hypothetical protein
MPSRHTLHAPNPRQHRAQPRARRRTSASRRQPAPAGLTGRRTHRGLDGQQRPQRRLDGPAQRHPGADRLLLLLPHMKSKQPMEIDGDNYCTLVRAPQGTLPLPYIKRKQPAACLPPQPRQASRYSLRRTRLTSQVPSLRSLPHGSRDIATTASRTPAAFRCPAFRWAICSIGLLHPYRVPLGSREKAH